MPGFGAVASNGLIVRDGGRVLLVDTAWTDDQTAPDPQLDQAGDQPAGRAGGGDSTRIRTRWAVWTLHAAGLRLMPMRCRTSFAPQRGLVAAQHSLTFAANGWVEPATAPNFARSRYFTPAPATPVTITVGIDGTDIAFGGCLIKDSKAKSLGNLGDADTGHYAASARAFGAAFPRPA